MSSMQRDSSRSVQRSHQENHDVAVPIFVARVGFRGAWNVGIGELLLLSYSDWVSSMHPTLLSPPCCSPPAPLLQSSCWSRIVQSPSMQHWVRVPCMPDQAPMSCPPRPLCFSLLSENGGHLPCPAVQHTVDQHCRQCPSLTLQAFEPLPSQFFFSQPIRFTA